MSKTRIYIGSSSALFMYKATEQDILKLETSNFRKEKTVVLEETNVVKTEHIIGFGRMDSFLQKLSTDKYQKFIINLVTPHHATIRVIEKLNSMSRYRTLLSKGETHPFTWHNLTREEREMKMNRECIYAEALLLSTMIRTGSINWSHFVFVKVNSPTLHDNEFYA